ncbi:Predicted arabinose efflux permease, MFS family [Asanoa hainanensis]|uniref:Predicted arabinose efflux permease, MFS family n=1 Tax=Asanoa hainanensis TaxID=560556 RepID=A0A239PEP6_9ACTN|nr:MFS transporter [Asanoa hainanensis]SNT65547.1 Predicted arabinose efflux permease, MFS family [Asanoa hainanensis]
MDKYLGALRERDFRNLYAARAFSLFGDGMVPVALAFAVLETDNSATALGLVLASRYLALVGMLLVGGVVADRLPRRLVLISSDLVRLVTQALIAVLLITGTAQIWHLAALAFAYGIGDAFFRPTSTGIIPQTVSKARMQQANALISLTSSSFTILGPIVAAIIIAAVGVGWAFALDAATFLVSAAFIARLPVLKKAAATSASFVADLKEGWSEFTSRRWLWVDGVYSALGSFAVLAPFLTLGPVIANNELGGATAWATILTAFGIGSVLGGIALLRVQPTRPLVAAVIPLTLLALPNALLALSTPTIAIAVGAFAGGLGLAFFNTLFETTVQMNVPQQSLSRIAAIDWMLSSSLLPLGAALAGPAAALVGADSVFWFSVVWIIGSTLVVISVPEIRSFRSAQAPAETGAELASKSVDSDATGAKPVVAEPTDPASASASVPHTS